MTAKNYAFEGRMWVLFFYFIFFMRDIDSQILDFTNLQKSITSNQYGDYITISAGLELARVPIPLHNHF